VTRSQNLLLQHRPAHITALEGSQNNLVHHVLFLPTTTHDSFTSTGFTEASARAALEIAERKVMALQRFIKRTCEREIFNPLIQQASLDPAKANCRLNWGREKPEVKLNDLIRLAEISATTETSYVRPEEVRKNLVKAGFELWEKKQ